MQGKRTSKFLGFFEKNSRFIVKFRKFFGFIFFESWRSDGGNPGDGARALHVGLPNPNFNG
jgi:hypothetical protein